MWIATLRDDAHHVQGRSEAAGVTATEKRELRRLAKALAEAAAILESVLPADASTKQKRTR